jgi:hypothetical protein
MDRRVAQETVELTVLFSILFTLSGCGSTPEGLLRARLDQTTGVIRLPLGVVEIYNELQLAPGSHDLTIVGTNTTLKASTGFRGRAILSADSVRNIRITDVSFDGNSETPAQPLEMAPPENAFRIYYKHNALLIDRSTGVEISDAHFTNITNFAILVSRSSGVRIADTTVEDSGSLDPRGRNNTTGGIVIEEGSSDFSVRHCTFRNIRGNALWTHSLYISPRLKDGVFSENNFDTIGRDAIEVAHASSVRVERNTGTHIGYPPSIVDIEHGGTPVAMDTAGNVDQSSYLRNYFTEIDGKCIDLDGFHDGVVRENECVNRGRAEDYPFGHFGIVMNNANPDMESVNIEISANVIDGAKFGGLFVIGRGHRIIGNTFAHLDLAGCNENAAKFGCIYKQDEPEMLESGIYLGRGAERPAETRANIIQGNKISGHKMKIHCIVAGPGVSLSANTIEGNQCRDDPAPR